MAPPVLMSPRAQGDVRRRAMVGAANRSRRPAERQNSRLPEPHLYMKSKLAAAADQEPVGIVISRGSRQEQVPAVFAYVWGPAPEPTEEVRETRVA